MKSKKSVYFYRNHTIGRSSVSFQDENRKGWNVIELQQEFKTLDEAKNAIDKILGGWSGRCRPKRHDKINTN